MNDNLRRLYGVLLLLSFGFVTRSSLCLEGSPLVGTYPLQGLLLSSDLCPLVYGALGRRGRPPVNLVEFCFLSI